MGLHGPVSEEEFDPLENFYRRRSEAVRMETCHRVTEFSNVMALPLGAAYCALNQCEPPRGLVIEQVDHGQVDLWTITVSQGFAEKGRWCRKLWR